MNGEMIKGSKGKFIVIPNRGSGMRFDNVKDALGLVTAAPDAWLDDEYYLICEVKAVVHFNRVPSIDDGSKA